MRHPSERHLVQRVGWLRAAVLSANDGIISTSSLVVGIASAQTSSSTVMLTGVAAPARSGLGIAVASPKALGITPLRACAN